MGNTAVITGSTGRLGGAIALALARAGCGCVCHYHRNETRASELVDEIGALGQKAVSISADLTCGEQIERLFAERTDMPPVRILINSASIFCRQPLADVTAEDAEKVISANLIAPVLVSQRFVKSVKQSAGTGVAKIINLVDVGGIRPWANYSIYCASKAGLIAVTKSLAGELAPDVCVNAIAPGTITWPKEMDDNEKARQLSYIPAGRIGRVDEVASAVIFLLENDYITGQVLNIDGGRCI